MKKIIGILGVTVIAVAMFFNTNVISNSNGDVSLANLFSMNTANAECEVEVKVGPFWKTILVCDSTPNETCSFEKDGISFTCSGKKTYQY